MYSKDIINLEKVIVALISNKLIKENGSNNDVQDESLVVCRIAKEQGFGKKKN